MILHEEYISNALSRDFNFKDMFADFLTKELNLKIVDEMKKDVSKTSYVGYYEKKYSEFMKLSKKEQADQINQNYKRWIDINSSTIKESKREKIKITKMLKEAESYQAPEQLDSLRTLVINNLKESLYMIESEITSCNKEISRLKEKMSQTYKFGINEHISHLKKSLETETESTKQAEVRVERKEN